jgi:cell volume regulation protein A
VIYGAASVAYGSGFLAVFVAGLLVGAAPVKAEIERFHTSLASLAEIVAFVALGLTIELGSLDARRVWLDGILLAVITKAEGADRIYGIVFVFVLFSVVVQGTSLPLVASRVGVPIRIAEPGRGSTGSRKATS